MSGNHQQPIEMSPMVMIAIGVVVMVGLLGRGKEDDQGADIVRLSGETIEFNSLGVKIGPAEGWSHLSTAQHHRARRLVYVNEAANLIVKFGPFPFSSWPPTADQQARNAIRLPKDPQISTDQYDHLSIQWCVSKDKSRLYGRLKHQQVDLLVEVWTHSGDAKVEGPLTELCNAIQPAH